MGRTLWQILTKQVPEEPDMVTQFFNPLNLKCGVLLTINTLELESLQFRVQALREIKREIEGEEFLLADYDLTATDVEGYTVERRLRVIPKGNDEFTIILLDNLDSFGYNEEYHESLKHENNGGEVVEDAIDDKGNLVVDEEGEVVQNIYWRINDHTTEWHASTSSLSDDDGSGKVEEDEIKEDSMFYWDFWRETKDAGDNTVLEHYYIEMDEDDGFFSIWIGPEVDPNRIDVT